MSTLHSEAARRFNDNREKTSWHDATFWSLRQKRDNTASGLPEWEELREHASQIKQHTVTHLADYLEEFSTQLESRGVKVDRPTPIQWNQAMGTPDFRVQSGQTQMPPRDILLTMGNEIMASATSFRSS